MSCEFSSHPDRTTPGHKNTTGAPRDLSTPPRQLGAAQEPDLGPEEPPPPLQWLALGRDVRRRGPDGWDRLCYADGPWARRTLAGNRVRRHRSPAPGSGIVPARNVQTLARGARGRKRTVRQASYTPLSPLVPVTPCVVLLSSPAPARRARCGTAMMCRLLPCYAGTCPSALALWATLLRRQHNHHRKAGACSLGLGVADGPLHHKRSPELTGRLGRKCAGARAKIGPGTAAHAPARERERDGGATICTARR
ncbi:hypothetical protein BC628DRAFT_167750 [Trametes gibbosa]|nr:hypothetical protein BC628DRAFT_167750 [Trametes gibbosa]